MLELWPRADQLHFTLDHVHQLRQFVQLVFAQELADARDPRIFRSRQGTASRGVWDHASKFEQAKLAKIFSYARLGEENRPTILPLDCGRDDQEKRREK